MNTVLRILPAAVIVLLLVLLFAADQSRRQLTIERNDAIAANDSLVELRRTDSTVTYGKLARLSDSLKGLETALKRKPQVVTVTVLVPDTSTHTATDTVAKRDTLTLADSLIGPPVDVRAEVRIFEVSDSLLQTDWVLTARPHPIPITVDVGCRTNEGPYKPDVVIQVPTWVQVDSIVTTTKPDVCAPARLPGIRLNLPRASIGMAVLVGLGYILGRL